jgi:hypothetical protein
MERSYNIGVRIETIVTTEGSPDDIAFDLRNAIDRAAQEVAGKGSTGDIESFIVHPEADPFAETYRKPRAEAYRAGIARVGEVASLSNAQNRMPDGADRAFWYAAVLAMIGAYGNASDRFSTPDAFWALVHDMYKSMMDVKAKVVANG